MPRRTKIIATLGPASSCPKIMQQMVDAGVDVFRLNFSHSDFATHGQHIRAIEQLQPRVGHAIGILADLSGPKIRLGAFKDHQPIFLQQGDRCCLTTDLSIDDGSCIPVNYQEFANVVHQQDRLLLADGKLELIVESIVDAKVFCIVHTGGELRERQGINMPDLKLHIPSLTEDDRRVIAWLKDNPVTFVALSFVQTANDVYEAKRLIQSYGLDVQIIAKIEKPQALQNIEEILAASDGIMIARGDLGIEIPTATIPVTQKNLLHLAFLRKKLVITATQMLDSMIYQPRPTRAEATDVANAIWDGTDAVMLSGETAMGNHPVITVTTMVNIIEQAELNNQYAWIPQWTKEDALILHAVAETATPGKHRCIITFTESGQTAYALSKLRPRLPIIAITHKDSHRARLSLSWGVQALTAPRGNTVDELIALGEQVVIEAGLAKPGDLVVVTAGTSLTSGATNMMKIHQLSQK